MKISSTSVTSQRNQIEIIALIKIHWKGTWICCKTLFTFSSKTILCLLPAVTMKDDILTAVTTDFNLPPNTKVPNVAPIAPLPSRLSFCLSPQRQQQLDSMLASGSTPSATSSTPSQPPLSSAASCAASSQKTALAGAGGPSGGCTSVVIENDLEELEAASEANVIISPTKKLLTTTTSTNVESATSSGK